MEKPTSLLIDPDPASQKIFAGAFNRAGINCRFIREPRKTASAIRVLKPDVVVVHAEIASPPFKQVMDEIASDVAFAAVPVVVLSTGTADAKYLEPFRRGVVGLLPLPFSAAHADRLKALLEKLPERSGRLAGEGDRAALSDLLDHVRRAQRAGVLIVEPLTPDEGKAFFANGVMKSAQQGQRSGSAALSAMMARPKARWIFSEVGDEDEGAAVVIEVGGDDPAEGVSVEIEVPVVSEEYLLEEVIEEPAAPPVQAGPPTPILLVDDDPELCRMFGLYFKKHGFDVATAPDGVQGFEKALAHPFEAIVADLNMPNMDGWGLLRLLREDFRSRETPVAFLSCHDDYRESLKALDAGAQAYFSKSTRLDSLAIQVREVLQPRVAFQTSLAKGQPFTVALSHVGPQWALREMARAKVRAKLEAKDGWGTFQISMRDGELVQARAQSGRHTTEGERALSSFIASRGAEGTIAFGELPATRSIQGSLDEVLGRCDKALNENERNLRDGLMVAGKEIHVNPDLYKLYAQVGPKPWLAIARMLCEEKLTPREVIAKAASSPVEVEEAMRDLIRRGVVRLSA